MDKQYIIFDMDGTLLDSMGFWRRLIEDYSESQDIPFTRQMALDTERLSTRKRAEYFVANFDVDDSVEDIVAYCYARMGYYYEHNVTLRKGVMVYLQKLKQQGVRMAIATATDRELALPTAKRFGLMDYMDELVSVNDIGIPKSRPDLYLKLTDAWGIEPSECAVFEDAPYAMQTAKATGFYTIMIKDESYAKEQAECMDVPDLVIDEMSDML